MNGADFEFVRTFVRQQAGVVLEPGKDYLVESRLQTLARREGRENTDDLVATLRADPGHPLSRKILDAMMIGDTSFFRDLHPFEALHRSILPELLRAHQADRHLRIWCGAASSGQEPFSVLMMLAEHFPDIFGWELDILSTDLSLEALEHARAGRFSQLEVNRGLSPALLMKYFTLENAEWEFRADLRARTEFRELNLLHEWSGMPPQDLILLRNVLVHFDLEAKQSVLAKARDHLRPGGYLILGAAENLANLVDGFETVVSDKATYYRLKPA